MLNVGLIGNGAIARLLAGFCAERPDRFRLVGALVRDAALFSAGGYPLMEGAADLLDLKPDMVVECAGHAAVAAYAAPLLRAGVDVIVVSTGSLADANLWDEVREAAQGARARLRLPAGAVPGIDALGAARLAGLSEVRLTSAKPPLAWSGTVAEDHFDLDAIQEPTEIFRGDARAAALAFPKNANVAATVALAGVGFERTEVRLVADPAARQNIHRLEAKGGFGEMALEVKASPAPGNPKTSYLAALSVMRLLENEAAGVVI